MTKKKEKQKSVRAMNLETPVIFTDNPKTLQICKQNEKGLQINVIVTHDGKIPESLKIEGWTLYRLEFEKNHNSEFHKNEFELSEDQRDFKIEKRKSALVQIFKNHYRMSIEEYKTQKKDMINTKSFEERKKVLPDYKIQNAILGVYLDSEERLEKYNKIIKSFVDASKKIQEEIDIIGTHEQVFKIIKNFEFFVDLD